ncbi:MAG: hypothetical protein GX640_22030 [Fibrobacter sp.]|nr:hypothetical protein [Fibrobacter sp.]
MKLIFVFTLTFALTVSICAASGSRQNSTELDLLFDQLFSNLPDSIANTRLTVIPFTENTAQGKGYGESMAEFMIVKIQKFGSFTLVDRGEFQRVVNEISLSQSGMIDDSATVQIGKMLSSQYLLSGSISLLFGKYRITAKLIHTETTQIIRSAAISVNLADLENFSKELLGESGKVSSAVFRSLIVPGWGQFYTNHNVRGAINISACVIATGATGYFTYQTAKYKSQKDKHIQEQSVDSIVKGMTEEQIYEHDNETKRLYYNYSRNFDHMKLSIIALGALWAINLVDASIAGFQAKKKFQLYFSGNISGKSLETGIVLRF